jgi:transposase
VFGFGPATRIYAATGATDMRKEFDGLYGLIRDRLGCDPTSGHVFLLQTGKRPALPGRQSMFDSSGRPSQKLQT